MWPDTRLLDLFGIELPIVQAPMANATGVEMAVAVAKAGGLGSLPCAMLGTDKIRAGITEFRTQSNRPFNLNFFCHAAPAWRCGSRAGLAHASRALLCRAWRNTAGAPAEGRVTALRRGDLRAGRGAEARNRELSFRPAGAGLPTRVKAAGCKIVSSATSVKEAIWLAERGVDAIIAQGAEAGGHRGMFLETDVAAQVGHLRARASDRRCREGSGDCRRRHRRCARSRRRLRARRVGRADRHGLSPLPRGAYLRACIARR